MSGLSSGMVRSTSWQISASWLLLQFLFCCCKNHQSNNLKVFRVNLYATNRRISIFSNTSAFALALTIPHREGLTFQWCELGFEPKGQENYVTSEKTFLGKYELEIRYIYLNLETNEYMRTKTLVLKRNGQHYSTLKNIFEREAMVMSSRLSIRDENSKMQISAMKTRFSNGMRGRIAFIGPSGVGKSSVLNSILLSLRQPPMFQSGSCQGHVTTRLTRFQPSGLYFELIDMPGFESTRENYPGDVFLHFIKGNLKDGTPLQNSYTIGPKDYVTEPTISHHIHSIVFCVRHSSLENERDMTNLKWFYDIATQNHVNCIFVITQEDSKEAATGLTERNLRTMYENPIVHYHTHTLLEAIDNAAPVLPTCSRFTGEEDCDEKDFFAGNILRASLDACHSTIANLLNDPSTPITPSYSSQDFDFDSKTLKVMDKNKKEFLKVSIGNNRSQDVALDPCPTLQMMLPALKRAIYDSSRYEVSFITPDGYPISKKQEKRHCLGELIQVDKSGQQFIEIGGAKQEGELVQLVEESLDCSVCSDPISFVLMSCGHCFCENCAVSMSECWKCKEPKTEIWKLKWDC
jgi:hypothetical protein